MAVSTFGAVRGGLMASLRNTGDPDNSQNVMCRFRPPFRYDDGLGVAAAVTDAAINVLTDAEGNTFAVRLEQAFAAAAPQVSAHDRGAAIALDASGDDGFSIDLGYGAVTAEIDNSRGRFVIGTAEPFYLKVTLEIGDVSDADQVAVGFVVGGHPADGLLDTYTDYAVLNVDNGQINIETRLNSGTASVTDTTQDMIDWTTAGDTFALEVRVDKGGKVNFLINGAEPTVDVTNFTFDDADSVNAVLTVLADADSDPTVIVHAWESGFLSSRGPDSITDLED